MAAYATYVAAVGLLPHAPAYVEGQQLHGVPLLLAFAARHLTLPDGTVELPTLSFGYMAFFRAVFA